MTTSLKLTYFDLPGRGEPIRQALRIGGVAFDDARIAHADWPALKSSGKFPFDSMPVIEIDGGLPLSQSNAVLKYAGKLSGLYPSDPALGMEVDQVLDACEDLFGKIGPDFQKTTLPWFCERIVRILSNNSKSDFLVGGSLTVADLKLLSIFVLLSSGFFSHIKKDFLDLPEYKEIADYLAKVKTAIDTMMDSGAPAAESKVTGGSSAAPELVLKYFPIGGRAASIRSACKLGKVEFKDNHVAFADWGAMKAAGTTPFDGMPTMTVNGGPEISQCNGILVYVGQLGGLYPADPVLGLKVDQVLQAIESLMSTVPRSKNPEELKTAREEFAATKLKFFLGRMERILTENGGTYFAGESLTVADLKVYHSCKALQDGFFDHIPTTCLDGFPKILANLAAVADALA